MSDKARREQRWIILGSDGRHVTLGRQTDPTEDEILIAENSMRANGLSGWLAIMDGDYYASSRPPHLLLVRRLTAGTENFEHAAAAFEDQRRRLLEKAD